MKHIAVIGGGAAGTMAAYAAALNGASVTVYEHNEKIGKKLFITGKGRCNLSNDCDTEEFFSHIPRNAKFLYSAVYTLPQTSLVGLFLEHGLATKVERGGRIFPMSDKSSDVIKTLEKMMKSVGVRICLNTGVRTVRKEGALFTLENTDGKAYKFDRVIVATGGISYKSTGSTGDGYRFARGMGLEVKDPKPTLVPLVIRERHIAEGLQGLSLKNVVLSVACGGKPVFSEMGELLFTHFGISGPLVLSASAVMPFFQGARAEIDLKPALTEKVLDKRLLRDFEGNGQKRLKTAVSGLFPERLAKAVLEQAGLDEEKQIAEVTKADRERLIQTAKRFSLHIDGARSINEAIVTRGGVCVKEIDPSKMESKKVSGMYFAGEVIDVDGFTGGYNLQIAFSTGYLAGMSAAVD